MKCKNCGYSKVACMCKQFIPSSNNSSQKKEIGSMTHSTEVVDKDPDKLQVAEINDSASGSDIPLFEKVLKQHWVRDYDGKKQDVVMIKDVAEAVRKLKEQLTNFYGENNGWCENIDKIFYPKKKGHEGEFK